jgi:hypothetical protein
MAGAFLITAGLAGTVVSLFWDVLSKGKAFALDSIGPLKQIGITAGTVLLVIGLPLEVFSFRRKAPGLARPSAVGRSIRLAGVILVLGGTGGYFLSLFWDVIGHGRPFSAGAMGPGKIMGMTAGVALLIIGAMALSVSSGGKAPSGRKEAAGRRTDTTARPEAGSRKEKGAAPAAYPPSPAEDAEIPLAAAIPIAESPPPGRAPMEAIPIAEARLIEPESPAQAK